MFQELKQRIRQFRQNPGQGEIAVSENALFQGSLFRAFNPDQLARRKGGLRVYDEMRIDDEVKSALTLKKFAVLAPGWMIEPASQDNEDLIISEFVEYCFGKLHGTIADFLFNTLSALDYGYSINEIVWLIFKEGPFPGKIGINYIKHKKPHFYEFSLDRFSNILPNGLIQTILGGPQPLPVDKFVIYTYQKDFFNWYGTSDLRSAYRSFWAKDNIIKFWNIYLERYGMPLAIGELNTSDPKSKTALKKVLKNLQSKTSVTYSKGDFDIKYLEAVRRSTSDYEKSLQFHNKAIARSILIPDRLNASGGSGDGGAFAQSKVHFDVFLWVVNYLRGEIEDSVMQEQVIRRLVNMNFGNVRELPQFKFKPLTDDQKKGLVTAFSDSVQKGAISPTFKDENHIRAILSFPEKEEEDLPVEPIASGAITGTGDSNEAQGNAAGRAGPGNEGAQALLKQYVMRDKNNREKSINFKQIEKDLDSIEETTTEALKKTLTKQRDWLTDKTSKTMNKGQLTFKFINDLVLKFSGELRKTVNKMNNVTYDQGRSDGKKELPKKFAAAWKAGNALPPEKAINYLESKSNFTVASIEDPLLKETQAVLVDSLRTGRSVPETVKRLQDAYIPYLEDGNVIKDTKQLTSFRLEAIVRTSQSEAYNYGRRQIGDDPDLKDFVLGYQFSEVIDSRTVEVSRFADGKTIEIKNPLLETLQYPLHWNERGVFVFVTSNESPVIWTGDEDLATLSAMAKETKP